jgi:hypothetical protein
MYGDAPEMFQTFHPGATPSARTYNIHQQPASLTSLTHDPHVEHHDHLFPSHRLPLLFEGKLDSPTARHSRVGYELFGMKAFFDGDWKILWMPPPFGPGEWELFYLARDPGELNDLSDDDPDRLATMVAAWERYREENGVLDMSPPNTLRQQ